MLQNWPIFDDIIWNRRIIVRTGILPKIFIDKIYFAANFKKNIKLKGQK